jgi:hypothetical protein
MSIPLIRSDEYSSYDEESEEENSIQYLEDLDEKLPICVVVLFNPMSDYEEYIGENDIDDDDNDGDHNDKKRHDIIRQKREKKKMLKRKHDMWERENDVGSCQPIYRSYKWKKH